MVVIITETHRSVALIVLKGDAPLAQSILPKGFRSSAPWTQCAVRSAGVERARQAAPCAAAGLGGEGMMAPSG